MKKLLLPFLLIQGALLCQAQSIVYVNGTATGANNGTSWQNAYKNLVDAVQAAPAKAEIWVSRTASYSVSKNNLNTDHILVTKDLSFYGGFIGIETNKSQRLVGGKTVVTGEIGTTNTVDNSYNAFVLNAAVSFDGFQFSSFYSRFENLTYNGALVAEMNSTVSLNNVAFTGNEGTSRGVCMSAMKAAVVNITRATIQNNNNQAFGSLFVHNDDAVLRFDNCTFSNNGNEGDNAGWGYVFYSMGNSSPSLALNKKVLLDVHNCRFQQNYLDIKYSYFGSNSFRKCEFALEPGSSNIFDIAGDSATFLMDSCSITGRYEASVIHASNLSSFRFTNSTFDNPTNDAYYFFDINADRIHIENAEFNNIRGSIPVDLGEPNAEIYLKNVSFLGGDISSYLLYVTGKKLVCEDCEFIDIDADLGTYILVDSARFIGCKFNKLPGYNAFIPFDYIKSAVVENCEFSEQGPSQPLFRVTSGNELTIRNSLIKDIVMVSPNSGAPVLFANWSSKLTVANTRVEHIRAYGYIADNGGETVLTGNIFSDVDAPTAFFINKASLSVYNSNFENLGLPLFLNDSSYNQGKPIQFTLANSVVYNSSDTLVLTHVAAGNYTQDISHNYTNKSLPGGNTTNQSKVPYADLYATSSFAGLQDKGRSMSNLPATDILGNPRVKFGAIDIGAIEFQGILTALVDPTLAENGFTCYPNPTKEVLWIETEEPATVELYDLKGAKVLASSVPIGKSQLSLESLESGMYVLALQAGTRSQRWRVMKR